MQAGCATDIRLGGWPIIAFVWQLWDSETVHHVSSRFDLRSHIFQPKGDVATRPAVWICRPYGARGYLRSFSRHCRAGLQIVASCGLRGFAQAMHECVGFHQSHSFQTKECVGHGQLNSHS